MLDYELGVIGAGNMATAILRGVIETDCLPENAIVAYDPDAKREQLPAWPSALCHRLQPRTRQEADPTAV